MSDLEAYTTRVGASAFKARLRLGRRRVVIGEYDGLTAKGAARLIPKRRETFTHHRGYLAGHLTRWVCERGWPIDDRLKIVFCYAAGIAMWWPENDAVKEQRVVWCHLHAVLSTEKKVGRPLTGAEERMLYGWLCEQAGIEVTTALVNRMERLRAKRFQKKGYDDA